MLKYTTNRELFCAGGDELDPGRVRMVWQLVQEQLESKKSHPIRVFIKREPHKRSKIEQGRYRLIYSISVVDTIIDRMLCGEFANNMFANWLNTPSMIGWSQMRGGWKLLPNKGCGYDFSAWEYTVREWLIRDLLEILRSLCVTDLDSRFGRWSELLSWRFKQLFNDAIIHFSNGVRLRQKFVGLMKSGTFLTIIGNTIMQCLLYYAACFQLGITPGKLVAMGDDTFYHARLPEVVLNLFKEWGFVVKGWEPNEFCGMHWDGRYVEPAYRGKHLSKLLHLDEKTAKETLWSYQLTYGGSSWLGRLRQIILNSYPEAILPLKRIFAIFDGEM